MGLWVGIKRALNSTVGTKEFKPLDQIIKGQRTLGASDNVIAVISNTQGSGATTFPMTFTPKTNGIIRLIAKGCADSTSYTGTFSVLENGVRKYNIEVPVRGGSADFTTELNVNADCVYSFARNSNTTTTYIAIGAQIIDGSLFEVNTTG